jgi:hypothetical protein
MEKDLEYFETMFANKTALSLESVEDIQAAGKRLIELIKEQQKELELFYQI